MNGRNIQTWLFEIEPPLIAWKAPGIASLELEKYFEKVIEMMESGRQFLG